MISAPARVSLLLALSATACLQAATIGIENITGSGSDLAIVNSSGTPITPVSGFFAVYQFTSPPATFEAMKLNGNTGLLGQVALSPGNYLGGGAVSTNISFTNVAGANIYLAIGNGASVAASTELGLINITGHAALTGSDSPVPQSLGNYAPLAGDVIVGTVGSGTYDWTDTLANANYTTTNFKLAAVPEPSAGLLSALGTGLLLIRRRR